MSVCLFWLCFLLCCHMWIVSAIVEHASGKEPIDRMYSYVYMYFAQYIIITFNL